MKLNKGIKIWSFTILGSLAGIFTLWIVPNIFFYWDYGLLFAFKESFLMLTNEFLFGAVLLILVGIVLGGMVGHVIGNHLWG